MLQNKEEEEEEGWNSGDPGILPLECLAQWKIYYPKDTELPMCHNSQD